MTDAKSRSLAVRILNRWLADEIDSDRAMRLMSLVVAPGKCSAKDVDAELTRALGQPPC